MLYFWFRTTLGGNVEVLTLTGGDIPVRNHEPRYTVLFKQNSPPGPNGMVRDLFLTLGSFLDLRLCIADSATYQNFRNSPSGRGDVTTHVNLPRIVARVVRLPYLAGAALRTPTNHPVLH